MRRPFVQGEMAGNLNFLELPDALNQRLVDGFQVLDAFLLF